MGDRTVVSSLRTFSPVSSEEGARPRGGNGAKPARCGRRRSGQVSDGRRSHTSGIGDVGLSGASFSTEVVLK